MKITVLAEDRKPADKKLLHEHGLCLFCETGGHKFLFDLGETDVFLKNAHVLGIDIASVEFAVISHAHSDHGGGLAHFVSVNRHAPIYLSGHAPGDYYVKEHGSYAYAGLDKKLLKELEGRLKLLDGDTQIIPGIHIVAGMQNDYPLPAFCALMAEKKEGVFLPDTLAHEVFMAVEEEDGAKILTGCSHHGIRNITAAAKKKFPSVTALAGGFHLYGAKYAGIGFFGERVDSIKKIGMELKNIPKIYTGHCTGSKAYRILNNLCGAQYLTTGKTFIL